MSASDGPHGGNRPKAGGPPTGPNQTAEYPNRKHPFRLAPQAYRVPGAVVFITASARPGVSLLAEGVPDRVLGAMLDVGRRHGVKVHAYCLMPDHLHVVCSVAEHRGDIALWLRRFKSAASRRCGHALWHRSYFDRHARAGDDVVQMVEYTLANPERKGLCQVWTDWPWSWSEWHTCDLREGRLGAHRRPTASGSPHAARPGCAER
jgi:putative transposase